MVSNGKPKLLHITSKDILRAKSDQRAAAKLESWQQLKIPDSYDAKCTKNSHTLLDNYYAVFKKIWT